MIIVKIEGLVVQSGLRLGDKVVHKLSLERVGAGRGNLGPRDFEIIVMMVINFNNFLNLKGIKSEKYNFFFISIVTVLQLIGVNGGWLSLIVRGTGS